MNQLNQWVVSGTLTAFHDIRQSPAGLKVVPASLAYQGSVTENGIERQLAFDIEIIAVGQMADALEKCQIGDQMELSGFIAPKSKRSRQWILHIQTLNIKE